MDEYGKLPAKLVEILEGLYKLMGLFRSDLDSSIITVIHPGAASRVTYYVDGHPLCLRPLKSEGKQDQYCSNEAGQGTGHLGSGPCNKHNGNQADGILARYGKYLKRELYARYTEFSEDDAKLLDMYGELALLKTILTETVQMYQSTQSLKALELTLKVIQDIGNIVERMDRIQSRQTITAGIMKMMFMRGLNTAQQFVPPESLTAFVELWRSNVGSLLTMPASQLTIEGLPPEIAQLVEQERD